MTLIGMSGPRTPEEAISYLKFLGWLALLVIVPSTFNFLIKKAEEIFIKRNPKEYIEKCTQKISGNPKSTLWFYRRALAYFYLKDGWKAYEDIKMALQVSPKSKKYQDFKLDLEVYLMKSEPELYKKRIIFN